MLRTSDLDLEIVTGELGDRSGLFDNRAVHLCSKSTAVSGGEGVCAASASNTSPSTDRALPQLTFNRSM